MSIKIIIDKSNNKNSTITHLNSNVTQYKALIINLTFKLAQAVGVPISRRSGSQLATTLVATKKVFKTLLILDLGGCFFGTPGISPLFFTNQCIS